MNQETGELLKILETRNQATIATAKSLLEGAGIEFAVNNEISTNANVTNLAGGIQLWVKPEDADAALHILRGLGGAEEQSEQPFAIRALIALGVVLIPIILAIIYSINN